MDVSCLLEIIVNGSLNKTHNVLRPWRVSETLNKLRAELGILDSFF